MLGLDSSLGSFTSSLLDYVIVVQRALAGDSRPRFFSEGFDEARLASLDAHFERVIVRLRAGKRPAELDTPIALEFSVSDYILDPAPPHKEKETARVRMREAFALSPLASQLSPEAQGLRVLYVTSSLARTPWDLASDCDAAAQARPLPSSIIVLMPATGEQGYRDRVAEARALIARSPTPLAALILMAPYYAARRPRGQRAHYQRTVGEYQAQSVVIVMECSSLILWAHNFAPLAKIVSTGFSWGAAMATGGALLALPALPPNMAVRQLAVMAYVGSISPRPLLTGLLKMDVDIKALEFDFGLGAHARLLNLFSQSNFSLFVNAMRGSSPATPFPLLGAAVTVTAADDCFIPAGDARALQELLADVAKVAQLKVQGGGHASAQLRRITSHVAAIEDALALLPGAAGA